ncbi:MAG: phosphodiester glycosidase family protein [Bacillota bacterium]|nr:phosphodiester glycosidase family protein [Bacillota bacterium]MDW7684660.1 phosphodiester glycosidase family protein [Bacillota bacterium]
MRRLLIALILVVLTVASVSAELHLPDLAGHWSEGTVREMVNRDLIAGYPDGSFKPDLQIKRGEFVKLLVLSLGLKPVEGNGHWALPYLAAALDAGVMLPEEYDTLDPEGLIPREEMAAYTARGISLTGGSQAVFTDYAAIAPQYIQYVTDAAANGIILGYPDNTFRPKGLLTRAEAAVVIDRVLERQNYRLQLGQNKKNVYIDGQSFTVNVVALEKDSVYPRVVLAHDQVQGLEDLHDMATRRGAVAAITGSFFDYVKGEPYGNLISNGWLIHRGDTGSTVGFLPDGSMLIDRLRYTIEGSTSNIPYHWEGKTWHAWNLNRTPAENGIYIYTRHRGTHIGFSTGRSVVVENGQVMRVVDNENVAIPVNGYVVSFNGYDIKHADVLSPGKYAMFRGNFTDTAGKELDGWNLVEDAVAAGPTLMKEGRIVTDLNGESVNVDAHRRRPRAVLGETADGRYLLVTVTATINETAEIMHALGTDQAINMDGGGSAGLWHQGKTITRPARKLNNTIIFTIRSGGL